MDPYGRAKTVRIGKWRWPPPQGSQMETDADFMQFKLIRQNQRKNTPMSQNSNDSSPNGSAAQVEWDEFEIENIVVKNGGATPQNAYNQSKFNQGEVLVQTTTQVAKASRRSFDIGAERPVPNSVGKLKLSSEMRNRLEQVTAGHSVRSSTSTTSDKRAPAKLEDARKMMLQQQLAGHFRTSSDKLDGTDIPSVRTQVQRMEAGKKPPPPPNVPAPPPPIRPPTTVAPVPIPPSTQQTQEMPAFYQRQERDTFGIHQIQQNWNGSEISKDTYDSWGRAEAAKLDMVYEVNYKKEVKVDRGRSRSRSRSRDRENFSEAVWDRNEVEGPPSTGSDRERLKEQEKRERMMEMKQVERERESQKVYQPSVSKPTIYEREKEKPVKRTSQAHERATFKTHMNQRMDRERKNSASTMITQSTEKNDDLEFNWQANSIPVPVPVPPALKQPAAACLTYNRVPWKLRVRKEMFRPSEPIGPPAALDLLFAQICYDVFGTLPCLRITPQERRNAINLLGGHGVTAENVKGQVRAIVKRHLIDMARGWPLYFARLFIVSASPQLPEVSILAISHSGVYLARRDSDFFSVIHSVPYAELLGATTLPRPASLQLNLKNGSRVILHAPRAFAIQQMIQAFCHEYKQVRIHTMCFRTNFESW